MRAGRADPQGGGRPARLAARYRRHPARPGAGSPSPATKRDGLAMRSQRVVCLPGRPGLHLGPRGVSRGDGPGCGGLANTVGWRLDLSRRPPSWHRGSSRHVLDEFSLAPAPGLQRCHSHLVTAGWSPSEPASRLLRPDWSSRGPSPIPERFGRPEHKPATRDDGGTADLGGHSSRS